MKGEKVWVPCEDSDGALLVTDAKTGVSVLVNGAETRSRKGLSRFGREIKVIEACGVLGGRDGDYLLVKFPGHKTAVKVRAPDPSPSDSAA